MAEEDYTAEKVVSAGEASDAPTGNEALFRKLKNWIRYDMPHVRTWRKEAREAFDFYAGRQLSDDDKNELRAKNRPVVEFNGIGPLVNAVVGSEINNRREVRYFPREEGDAVANEMLTAAGEWFRDETGAEDEESDAFRDDVIAGMGWTDTRLDFECEPDGAPMVDHMSSLEMGWDCNSVKPNLIDTRRLWRVREMDYEDAVELTGVKDKGKLNAGWIRSIGDKNEQHDQNAADLYTGEQNDQADGGYKAAKFLIVEIRWFERETYHRGPDLENPQQIKEYDDKQVKLLKKKYPTFPLVKQTRKVVRRAFLGSEILGEPDAPMVPPGMFGWECITGYKDETTNQWYGIVRASKDPARWSNKFFSQVMYLLNSQSKGGIGIERGAFENDQQGEESWAKSEAITYFKQGKLTGDKPAFIAKPTAQFPAGFFTLYQDAKEALTDVTGLSPEFIGTREVDQAGVLEYQRRQSSLNLLASLFNSLRRYRKRQGRTMLYLIQEHLADGRLIRIVGDDKKQYVPLMKEQVANKQYDIIVDDSPTSPNEKDRTWQILMQMLPMIKDLVTPDVAMELLALSPLPASLVEKLRTKAQEAAQQPKPPTPEEIKAQAIQQKAQLDAQGQQQDIAATQAKTSIELQGKQQSNAMDQQSQAIDAFYAQQEAQLKAFVAEQKAQSDMRNLAIKEQSNRIAAKRANSAKTSAAKS